VLTINFQCEPEKSDVVLEKTEMENYTKDLHFSLVANFRPKVKEASEHLISLAKCFA